MEQKKRFPAIYGMAILYVLSVYASPVLLYVLNLGADDEDGTIHAWPLALFAVVGVICFVYLLRQKQAISRTELLNCTVLIKYALIPFFIAGAFCIAFTLLFMLIPVVITVFLAPAVALCLAIYGWLVLLVSSPFSILYLRKAAHERVHSTELCVAAGVLQFFFTLDVLSVMVLTVKERRWVKLTVGVWILLAGLVIAAACGIVWWFAS